MNPKTLGSVGKVDKIPRRILKGGKQQPKLPIPMSVRQSQKLEEWREKIWQSKHKYLVELHPQFRELMRKMAFSMRRAGLPGMFISLELGLLRIWMLTGSLKKIEDFILRVWNGGIIFMDGQLFLPKDNPSDLPSDASFRARLLYDPACYEAGIDWARAQEAPHFSTLFVPSSPEAKHWIREWALEMDAVREQAATELGKGLAEELWAGSDATRGVGDHVHKRGPTSQDAVTQVAYW